MCDYVKFEDLIGKTLLTVDKIDNDKLIFKTTDGKTYKMYHEQDCCESVEIEDICGDFQDLIGQEIMRAEVISNEGSDNGWESYTWTFYKLDTFKSSVTIRWYGSSNGYYSESVDFVELTD